MTKMTLEDIQQAFETEPERSMNSVDKACIEVTRAALEDGVRPADFIMAIMATFMCLARERYFGTFDDEKVSKQ